MKKLKKILLIDDDQVNNSINKRLYEQVDLAEEIVVMDKVMDALDYLRTDCFKSKNYPSLILLDLSMPELNGFDFLKEFELLKLDKKNIVVVILTNSSNADDYIKLKELGSLYVFSKPLTIDKIIDIHHRYFRRSSFWALFT